VGGSTVMEVHRFSLHTNLHLAPMKSSFVGSSKPKIVGGGDADGSDAIHVYLLHLSHHDRLSARQICGCRIASYRL
jgi:hypothetical protein